jgi:hypothetical protein
LEEWGIRLIRGSIGDYGGSIDAYYKKIDGYEGDDEEEEKLEALGLYNWNPGALLLCPKNFPEGVTPSLEHDEAVYLMERLKFYQPQSLFAKLIDYPGKIDAENIWEYPDLKIFTSEQNCWIENARLFSKVMHGAALLYNVCIADLVQNDGSDKGKEWSMKYREMFVIWLKSIRDEFDKIKEWDLGKFWTIVDFKAKGKYKVSKDFVEQWVSILIKSDPTVLVDDAAARNLIAVREDSLKHALSRITSEQARKNWNGEAGSGIDPYGFRWLKAKSFLNEIFAGLVMHV